MSDVTSIKEALSILESAAAKDSHDLHKMLSSDYSHLKKAVFTSIPHAALDSLKEAKGKAVDYTVDKAKLLDESVHEHPWYFIGGTAVVATVLGFLFGRSLK